MASNLMDTEAGGEGSQYESIQTVTKPHSKQDGQMGGQFKDETQPDAVTAHQAQQKAERGEKTAENMRYGQAISEGGMGGKTTEARGSANQDNFGATDAQGGTDDDAEESRQNQGYGPGSGVGA
ncbi:MAG: hypothetical protein ALECFALPRED_004009 [Alectoria fallacina]|uniref:Uncharacterized protein n=1 Tax=Alectoria fallacina TaxID=1903189 RepID=A0A8H3FS57_9LECA|nr:MAG: hypothetical protein ALECFALPRED_004009 [Alectoria fallacina]